MKKSILLLSLFPLLGVSTAAVALDFYARGDAGLAMFHGKVEKQAKFYSGEGSFKKAFEYSAGLGAKITDIMRADISYGRIDNFEYDDNLDSKSGSAKKSNLTREQKLRLQSAMLKVYLDMPLPSAGCIKPYVGVGLGYARIQPEDAKIKISTQTAAVTFVTPAQNRFSYALMAGVAFNMNERLAVDVGYKFQDYGKNDGFASYQPSGGPKRDVADPYPGFKVRVHSIMGGLRFAF